MTFTYGILQKTIQEKKKTILDFSTSMQVYICTNLYSSLGNFSTAEGKGKNSFFIA